MLGGAVLTAGMLLWARLVLLEDIPRSGLADPDEQPAVLVEGAASGAADEESSLPSDRPEDPAQPGPENVRPMETSDPDSPGSTRSVPDRSRPTGGS